MLKFTFTATLRSLVDEWQLSTKSTACDCTLFNQNLTVWTNGYVIPQNQHTTPMSTAGYAELYQQRELIEQVAALLANESLSSESDYPWTIFATPAPEQHPVTASGFSKLLGFAQEAHEVSDMLKDADPSEFASALPSLSRLSAYLSCRCTCLSAYLSRLSLVSLHKSLCALHHLLFNTCSILVRSPNQFNTAC